MIRIRFHGRGGHGVKTASRIVGTAAFLQGLQAQDSPVYGAERRGAAVTAFTRIDTQPILERGMIEDPDLIIVGDETLLEDPGAAVLARQETASALFLNTPRLDGLAEKYGITPQLFGYDVTERTLTSLGKASALSSGLASAAARLVGSIEQPQLVAAIREELAEVRLSADVIDKNIEIASEVFAALDAVPIERSGSASQDAVHVVDYDDPLRGTPSILAPGNAEMRHTGSWRFECPVIDYDRCTRCGLCFVRCPDGAIALDDDGYPIIDYDNCKGCMICLQQCPLKAVWRTKEVPAS